MISITQKPFKLHTGHSKEKIRTNLQGCTLLWWVSLSLAEEIQLNKENNHGSSFHYHKRFAACFQWAALHYSSFIPPTDITSYEKHNTRGTPNTPKNKIYFPSLINRHRNLRFHISFTLFPNTPKRREDLPFPAVLPTQEDSLIWKIRIICFTEADFLAHRASSTSTEIFLAIENFNC